MSSRVNTKKPTSTLNKENDGALNGAQPLRKDLLEKKPVLKQSKSNFICQFEAQPESDSRKCVKAKEEVAKDLVKEERKKESIKFRKSETDKLMTAYGKTWISDMKMKENKSWPKNCLATHKISASVRAKMVVIVLPRSIGWSKCYAATSVPT